MATRPRAADTPTAPATSDYVVTNPLHHDGQPYAVGATVALTADQAAPLLGLAVKAPEAGQPAADPGEQAPAGDPSPEA